MIKLYGAFLLLWFGLIPTFGQQHISHGNNSLGFDFSIGILGDSNTGFPDHDLQKSFFINIGTSGFKKEEDWRYHLNGPKTGISLGFSDLGNKAYLGYAYSILPFAEFKLFPNKIKGFNLFVALGGSYMTKIFNKEHNPFNKAVSTRLNWSYKSFLYYTLLKNRKNAWRLGLGYFHHSNGHVRKPNRGYNAFLIGTSFDFYSKPSTNENIGIVEHPKHFEWFYTGRAGIGQNSFSDVFNSKDEVYTAAFSGGKIINKTFKVGAGLYYYFYRHYYKYIVNNETLVQTQEPHFRDHPVRYASALGIFGSAELLLGHFGMELNIGLNYFKPFYKIDWQLNEGYTVLSNGQENIVLGELDGYYKLKRLISSRMGLKYYLFDTNNSPKHNFFAGAFINANLGQADFSELTLGYVHRFNF